VLGHIHLNSCLKIFNQDQFEFDIKPSFNVVTSMGTFNCTQDQLLNTTKGWVPLSKIATTETYFESITWKMKKGIYTPIIKAVYAKENQIVFKIKDCSEILIDNFHFKF